MSIQTIQAPSKPGAGKGDRGNKLRMEDSTEPHFSLRHGHMNAPPLPVFCFTTITENIFLLDLNHLYCAFRLQTFPCRFLPVPLTPCSLEMAVAPSVSVS